MSFEDNFCGLDGFGIVAGLFIFLIWLREMELC